MRSSRRRAAIDVCGALMALTVGGILGWLSIARYRAYNAGMLDLGNMSQAIWSATVGRPLECTYVDSTFSRLSLHVELIYFLFAPVYAVFPSPVTLVVLQAGLFAGGGFPLYMLANRRLQHRGAARLIALTYLLYPVAQTAVLFDFHGDTLAMPLLLFAFEALDRKAYRSYALWLLLALCCKFYVAIPVSAFGLILALRGQRCVGSLTAVAGVVWFIAIMVFVRPAFAPPGDAPLEATGSGYVYVYFGRTLEMLTTLELVVPRLVTAMIVFAPALWLARFSPVWMFPAATTALPALSASGLVSAADYQCHHYALGIPFFVLACLEGAERLRQRDPVGWVSAVRMQAAIVLLFSALLVDTPLNPLFWTSPVGWGHDPLAYGVTARDELKSVWLAENVPDRVPLVASFFLAPHVSDRSVLFMPQVRSDGGEESYEVRLGRRLDTVDAVVLDALFDYPVLSDVPQHDPAGIPFLTSSAIGPGHLPPVLGGVLYDREAISTVLQRPDFHLVETQDGLLLFERQIGSLTDGLLQEVSVTEIAPSPQLLAQVTDAIGLVWADAVSLGEGRFRLEYHWVALRPLATDPPYIAVSRLDGVENARIVHLPTQALYPTTIWQEGDLVREVFETEIPETTPPGSYRLVVGWYDASHPFASFTDERSRVGKQVTVETIQIVNNAP